MLRVTSLHAAVTSVAVFFFFAPLPFSPPYMAKFHTNLFLCYDPHLLKEAK